MTEDPALPELVLPEPDEDAVRLAEALIFASAEPVTPLGLARVLPDGVPAEAVLAALRARYAGRGVELVEVGGGVMFRTAPDLGPRLRTVTQTPRRLPLGRPWRRWRSSPTISRSPGLRSSISAA